MASYQVISSRDWSSGPQNDVFSFLGKEMKQKRNKAEVKALYEEAKQDPNAEPSMSINSEGDATFGLKRKEDEATQIKNRLRALQEVFGGMEEAPVDDTPIVDTKAMTDGLFKPTESPTMPNNEFMKEALTLEAGKPYKRKNTLQSAVDSTSKKAPEGYEENVIDFVSGASKMPFKKLTVKEKTLSPALQNAKDKRTAELFDVTSKNSVRREQLQNAMSAAKDVEGGQIGAIKREWMKRFDSKNPILTKWQDIKSVLTDAQLMNTANTKGAISDREMELFSNAAANDDFTSLPRMTPVFKKLLKFMDAEERSKKMAYKTLYPDDGDPDQFLAGLSEESPVKMAATEQLAPSREELIAEAKRRGLMK